MSLFPPTLVSKDIAMPEGYTIRPLHLEDYHKGFLDCLKGLTMVGNVTFDEFTMRFRELNHDYYIVVIEDLNNQRIVGAGTLVNEKKFIRHCGKVGHIEDIVVDESQRGKRFGLKIIEQLKHIAINSGCYKVYLHL
eukprot:NODE_41_length_34096_cov_2.002235.p27 type:complete len:136 gc:universal NODE_41_length_34096_cov_2.002235:19726-20133(+)